MYRPVLDQGRSGSNAIRLNKHDPDVRSASPTRPRSDLGSDSDKSDLYWVDDDNRNNAWWEEAYVLADQGDDERVYDVTVGRETGSITRWYVLRSLTSTARNVRILISSSHRARAGSASQGHPGGKVRRLVTINPPAARQGTVPNVAWVVYEGLQPGVYDTW